MMKTLGLVRELRGSRFKLLEAEVPAELLRKASRSHGIGIRPDQKELWMCDVFHDRTYVFDLSAEPPKQTHSIEMKGGGYWMCFSPDGNRLGRRNSRAKRKCQCQNNKPGCATPHLSGNMKETRQQ